MLVLHAVCPAHFKNRLLLAASLLFYAWGEVEAFVLLIAATLINFAIARWLKGRPRLLAIGVVLNLLPLLWFKYIGFLASTASSLLAAVGLHGDLDLVAPTLPLGISFYTFQSISFLIDVYRNPALGRRGLVEVFLYTTFFPGMVAGPIERYGDIEPQLGTRRVGAEDLLAGLELFVRGLARKLLVANVLSAPADEFFGLRAEQMTTAHAWLAISCYAAQIYYDFGGYSDMALGLARMFGFRYPQNFKRPYTATSLTDFWRRWHISLSTWFRDYLYIPLGGNRRGAARTIANLVIVFLLCGLWHGAAWTFVVWGAWHGLGLVLERLGLSRVLARAPAMVGALYTASWVWLGWVFFRADDVPHALRILAVLAGAGADGAPVAGAASWLSPHFLITFAVAWIGACLPDAWVGRAGDALARRPLLAELLRALLVVTAFGCCLMALAALSHNPFIYYRF